MADFVLSVNMDKKCAECGEVGATGSGICLSCAVKAMDPKRKMRSREGRIVQTRWAETLPPK